MTTATSTPKVNEAARVREYEKANPTATPTQVAQALGIKVQRVYQTHNYDQKAKKAKAQKKAKIKQQWKLLHMSTSKTPVVKHLGVTMAKDDVSKLTQEQTARLAYNMTQGRTRMQGGVTMVEPQADNVNHPAHYKVGGIETIDYIQAKLSPEEFRGYLKGNILKYLSRAGNKGSYEEDLLKARWYMNREIAQFVK